MNTLVSCTSYILPSEEIWSKFNNISKIKFDDYGSLFSNKSKNFKNNVKIIFFRDL